MNQQGRNLKHGNAGGGRGNDGNDGNNNNSNKKQKVAGPDATCKLVSHTPTAWSL